MSAMRYSVGSGSGVLMFNVQDLMRTGYGSDMHYYSHCRKLMDPGFFRALKSRIMLSNELSGENVPMG